MFHGQLVGIHICPVGGGPMRAVESVDAVTGQGLNGDRYSKGAGTFQQGKSAEPSQEVTLIEREAIEAVNREYEIKISPADTRRNLLTEMVPLNQLVGQTFTVGDVTLRGVKLCEPCGHLEQLTHKGVEKALVHRGGLRAQVVAGGTLRVGDAVRPAG